MKRYRVIGRVVTVNPGGVLQLKKEQAAPRAHALSDLKKGLYMVNQPVQFKNGEEFGYDGAVSKSLMVDLADLKKLEEEEKKKRAETGEGGEGEDADPVTGEVTEGGSDPGSGDDPETAA
ncbi:hypothetical protein MJO47_09335 [Desulfuromonas sp. KJ2020]|uniref:hypothetical protein n=1 Tax=Desulfuromonas sp. KJ2020 TaxID=2919173 RepID=UPI0020A762D4|nr:hypothetical protein [Desulfuromonas sp. KJ2020]MCP3177300.1 hypothetical protein [Desulfuromonas sp. KJ2020]